MSSIPMWRILLTRFNTVTRDTHYSKVCSPLTCLLPIGLFTEVSSVQFETPTPPLPSNKVRLCLGPRTRWLTWWVTGCVPFVSPLPTIKSPYCVSEGPVGLICEGCRDLHWLCGSNEDTICGGWPDFSTRGIPTLSVHPSRNVHHVEPLSVLGLCHQECLHSCSDLNRLSSCPFSRDYVRFHRYPIHPSTPSFFLRYFVVEVSYLGFLGS